MTVALGTLGVRGVVLDIEGTTTPISFVYDVLFPYARSHLPTRPRRHITAFGSRPYSCRQQAAGREVNQLITVLGQIEILSLCGAENQF